jgi:hypothetical protein
MIEILQKIITVLKADGTLTAIVPSNNIMVGPVDIPMEQQKDLLYPQINIFQVSEVQRSNPLNTRDTRLQMNIWSRNSQLEVENIYERVIYLLSYMTTNQGSAHIFWQRLDGATDHYESGTRRLWNRSMDFLVWSVK